MEFVLRFLILTVIVSLVFVVYYISRSQYIFAITALLISIMYLYTMYLFIRLASEQIQRERNT